VEQQFVGWEEKVSEWSEEFEGTFKSVGKIKRVAESMGRNILKSKQEKNILKKKVKLKGGKI